MSGFISDDSFDGDGSMRIRFESSVPNEDDDEGWLRGESSGTWLANRVRVTTDGGVEE